MASRSHKQRTVVPFEPVAATAQVLPAVCIGHVVGFDPEHGASIDFPGNQGGPMSARLLVALDAATLAAAAAERRSCALLFERGDARLPLIVGLVETSPAAQPRAATIDGKRIVLSGEEEIELRCGEASISLKKNGKLVIRGAYVETRAKGTNRIKGGSVQIN
jgi:hypothetical protein